MSQTPQTPDNVLVQNIHDFARAAGETDRLLANTIQSTGELAIAAGRAAAEAKALALSMSGSGGGVDSTALDAVSAVANAAQTVANAAQTAATTAAADALTANSRLDTLSESQVSFIRIKGTNKPVDSNLRGLDEAAQRVVEAQVGDAFTFAHTGADVGRVVVNKDCIATVIGFGDAVPVAQNETGDANANFRLLVRRRVGSATGQSNIVVDCRQFIKAKKHTGALDLPVTVQLNANDRISLESACYDADRGNSTLTLTLIEHPNTLALDSQAADKFAQITTQLQSIEARLAALENPGS